MKYDILRPALVCLCLVLAVAAPGCRRRPPPAQAADPAAAREALRAALSAWQKGDSAESLAQGLSPIAVAEPKWQKNYRLVRYEISDKDEVVGNDLQCRVALRLRGPDGKEADEKAVYSVSTSPRRVVVRSEG